MRGYNSIQVFTLKDCFDYLNNHDEKDSMHAAVEERYHELINGIRKQEDADYQLCKSFSDFDDFIKKYSDKEITSHYSPQYLDRAKTSSENLFWKSHSKNARGCKEYIARYPNGRYIQEASTIIRGSKTTRWLVLGIMLTIIVIAFFIGYKPVNYVSADTESLCFCKWGGKEELLISTNVPSNMVDISVLGSGFELEGDGNYNFTIIANSNPGQERAGTAHIRAYASVFGYRIGNGKDLIVRLRQDSGLATKLIVSSSKFDFGKLGGTADFSVTTDGVLLDLSFDKDWATVSKIKEGEYKVSVVENPYDKRSGTISVKSGQFHREILLSQASGLATKFSIDKSNISGIPQSGLDEGRRYRVNVNTDGVSWDVSRDKDWIILKKYSSFFEITVTSNPGKVRKGQVSVKSNNGHVESIALVQNGEPSNLYPSTSIISPSPYSGSKTISINNDSYYNIIADGDKTWLHTSVIGDIVTIRWDSNSSRARRGVVTVTCGNSTCSIAVEQDGYKDCSRCGGLGTINCTNYKAEPRYYPMTGATLHQVLNPEGYYNMVVGMWIPQWENCKTCGGTGKEKCPKCDGAKKEIEHY